MIPKNKGIMIWKLKDAAGGDPRRLGQMARDTGFSWVAIKLANGSLDFNSDYAGPAIDALRAVGISVFGWQYLYGGSSVRKESYSAGEATAAVRNIGRYQVDGWILDPEAEYKQPGAAAWAQDYGYRLLARYPDLPLGLCSYRFPTYHRELPWAEFVKYVTFHCPQVYWVEANNPADQLQRSYNELLAKKNLPYIPIGAAFYERGWGPTVTQINAFNQKAVEMRLPGVGWWCWDNEGAQDRPGYWETIAAHRWEITWKKPGLSLEERVKRIEERLGIANEET